MEILIALGISLFINLLMFLPAFLFKTDKLTDISYAITFVLIALYSLFSNQMSTAAIIFAVMILLWALRLGIFLLIRVRRTGKDKRFNDKRDNFWKFGGFWLLQGISVWLIMIPSILFFSKVKINLDLVSYIGIIIWGCGLIIETVSDIQKFNFKKNLENNDRWIESGLWKYSRHPNYFGEIMLWVGIYLYVLPTLTAWESLLGAIGPIYIATIILFVSGIPILEKSADARWGQQNEYQNYRKRTSLLIPLPNKKL